MLPIVVPLTSLLAVEIVVAIEIIVVVNVDIPAAPVAIAPIAPSPAHPCCAECESGPPSQSHSWVVSRVGIGIIRIGGRSFSVHYDGIIRRDVNDVRIGLLNHDDLLATFDCLSLHLLLLGCLQSSFTLGLPPHPLDRVHHIGLLR
jgi:hypothetical protein